MVLVLSPINRIPVQLLIVTNLKLHIKRPGKSEWETVENPGTYNVEEGWE